MDCHGAAPQRRIGDSLAYASASTRRRWTSLDARTRRRSG